MEKELWRTAYYNKLAEKLETDGEKYVTEHLFGKPDHELVKIFTDITGSKPPEKIERVPLIGNIFQTLRSKYPVAVIV